MSLELRAERLNWISVAGLVGELRVRIKIRHRHEPAWATQRDVGRRKRDIRTIALKVRLENPKGAYVPGMTAEVLVPAAQVK